MLGPKRRNETEAGSETDGQASSPDRFERRRADIIAAAIPVLNSHGFKGMRLTSVAELIGLRATGVTYYFPRKEELAVACLETGYAIFHGLLDHAEREPEAGERRTDRRQVVAGEGRRHLRRRRPSGRPERGRRLLLRAPEVLRLGLGEPAGVLALEDDLGLRRRRRR